RHGGLARAIQVRADAEGADVPHGRWGQGDAWRGEGVDRWGVVEIELLLTLAQELVEPGGRRELRGGRGGDRRGSERRHCRAPPPGASTARSGSAFSRPCSPSLTSPARRRARRKQIGPTSSWTPIIATIRVSSETPHSGNARRATAASPNATPACEVRPSHPS